MEISKRLYHFFLVDMVFLFFHFNSLKKKDKLNEEKLKKKWVCIRLICICDKKAIDKFVIKRFVMNNIS